MIEFESDAVAECYIPLSQDSRARSLAILAEVGRQLSNPVDLLPLPPVAPLEDEDEDEV